MSQLFDIARKISAVIWTTEETEDIQDFLKSIQHEPAKSEEFFTYCRQWKLAPWCYSQFRKTNLLESLNESTRNKFETEYNAVLKQNEQRNSIALLFLTEFKKRGIDVIILKGNYLAHTVYKDVGYKRMNDFDILVHKQDWDRIQDVYFDLGFIPLGFGWSGEREKPAKFSHVGMSFISPDYNCIIGTQWGLKSPTTSYQVDIKEAWETAVSFEFSGLPVKALSVEYNLLHLILHMGIYKCGIRDCMDLYNLLLIFPLDKAKLSAIVKKANAEDKTYFTLSICRLCYQIPDFDYVQLYRTGKKNFLTNRLKKRLLSTKFNPDFQTSYNDYFQDIEKVVIYFNLFPKFHVKFILYLRILRMVYFPKNKIALKLNDKTFSNSTWDKISSTLKAPYCVFALISQEIGWKFTILLFVKLFFDLIVSLKNYFVKTESYFDYLKKRGIDSKAIENAVKNIQ